MQGDALGLNRRLWLLLLAVFCFAPVSFVWAENATATADDSDAVVAAKIIQPMTAATPKKAVAASEPTALNVADDMQGQTTRTLPSLNQPVIDQAHILTAAEQQQLSQKIQTVYQQGKAQIGIIIVPTTGQEDIFDYAMRVANQWKLGLAKQDNGLLIAVVVNDHRIQILNGYGLEGILPDAITSRIIRNQITPYFKQNQFAQGLDSGLNAIITILNQDPEIAKQAAENLKRQHEQALAEQQAREQMWLYTAIILVVGVFASFVVGNRVSAATASVAATTAGLVSGAGFLTSLLLGVAVFFLLITSLAQLILQMILSGSGRGGGSGGGFGGGSGGYGGGGGRFGGGGASGSW
ncbi:TPM domain-containing protein [Acinetobacter sp. MD2(2019)]|uniref:TPM domain-containing protein n=1 Tax=Acinetobacter sp. MD2(2019) TaxID=2605273 RepID=UPI002D1F300A|nr:TPM domain-containing protein [Acinetobacter sp. MD2(2019)]MEB3753216.1 TPM domain-containing protein [Acinetobacter sp. MD2(2019)]